MFVGINRRSWGSAKKGLVVKKQTFIVKLPLIMRIPRAPGTADDDGQHEDVFLLRALAAHEGPLDNAGHYTCKVAHTQELHN